MGRPFGLSKSRITLFEQCPKRLWLSVHRPALASESAGIRIAFADGHRVGDFACRLRPDGVMISDEGGLGRAVEETRKLLDSGWDKPIFEATFAHEGVLVRVDILEPRDGAWHVAEVKNTTGVKDYHIGDIATQLWVMRGAGVPVTSSAIRHLDRTFTLTREGDYTGLFADTIVTSLTEPVVAGRSQVVEAARGMLADGEPDIAPGAQCTTPFPCSFSDYCTRDLPDPPQWPVTLLPGTAGKALARRWLEQGIDDLTLVPPGSIANDRLARIHSATLSGEAFRNTAAIRAEVGQWVFPNIFLDFESGSDYSKILDFIEFSRDFALVC